VAIGEREFAAALGSLRGGAGGGNRDSGGNLGEGGGKMGAADFAAVTALAEAAGKRAFAAALDARTGRVEVGSAIGVVNTTSQFRKATLNADLVNDAWAKLKASSVRASVYARSAAESEARALKEVQEMKEAPAIVAQEVAQFAVAKLRRQAAQWRSAEAAEELELSPSVPPPLTDAAVQAMAPYEAAIQRTVAARSNYDAQAQQLSEQAGNLQQGARTLANEAVAYQRAGEKKLAQQMMTQAQGMLDKAGQADAQARRDHAAAQQLSQGLPAYQEYAKTAGARASALSRARWMPPAVGGELSGPGFASGPAPAPLGALLARGRSTRAARTVGR